MSKVEHLFKLVVFIGVCAFLLNPEVFALTDKEKEAGFVSLFNGQDLSGWENVGKPDGFVVEDGMIVCQDKDSHYLGTEKSYEDFILRLEYKIAPNGNSGLYFHIPPHGRISRLGGEVQIMDSYGRDPAAHIAGALYGAVAPKKNAAHPADQWNELELMCDWPKIKVSLNDIVVIDVDASENEQLKWRNHKGPIGFQDHGSKAWFRNIRIKELGGKRSKEWITLFNGKDFEGWDIIGDAEWRVEDGLMVAEDGNGYAITKDTFKDFHFWAYIHTSTRANGGIFYRWNKLGDRGHEAQIYNVEGAKNMTGSIYNRSSAKNLYARDGRWFLMQVIAQGDHSKVLVNGRLAAEYDRTVNREGHISLQMHRRDSVIRFKDVRIQPLD